MPSAVRRVELWRFFVTVLWMPPPPPDSVAREEEGEEGLNFLPPDCDFVVREREREARKTPTVDGNFFGFLDESILPNVELSFVKATAFSDQETVPRSVICLCCRRSAPIQVRTAALEGPHHHFWALFGHPTPPAENRTLVCHCQGQPPLFLDQKCVWKS